MPLTFDEARAVLAGAQQHAAALSRSPEIWHGLLSVIRA